MFGHVNPFVYILSVGHPSPFPTPISAGSAANLVADAAAPILNVTMAGPSQRDIATMETGSVNVALDHEGSSAFLIWRFSSPALSTLLVFDTPLHLGLENAREFPNFSTRGLAPGEERGATVVLQDGFNIVRLIRPVVLPRPILDGLAPLLAEQVAARADRKLKQLHRKDIRRYYSRTTDPAKAYDLAPIKARAS